MSFLVDANVLSEATRKNPEAHVPAWLEENEAELYLSAVTVGELQKGVALYPDSKKRLTLEKWLSQLLKAFAGRILPVDEKVALAWGRYYAAEQRRGQKPPTLDSLVAATAMVHELILASRNTKDFASLPVVNPWIEV